MEKQIGDGFVTEDDDFLFPAERKLTMDDIRQFINYHKSQLLPKYILFKKEYKGDHDILHRDARPDWKPDNRIVSNFAKYQVDTFNGFFSGIPVKVESKDTSVNESLNDWNNRTSFSDRLFEANKMASIYGRSYLMLYQNEESQTCLAECAPHNTFIIYSDDIEHKRLAMVNYSNRRGNRMKGYWIDDYIHNFDTTSTGLSVISETLNIYTGVPCVEIEENSEHMAIFQSTLTACHAIEKALSEKADNVEYFADAYLAITGAEIDEKTLGNLKKNRIINVKTGDDQTVQIQFLQKPDGDATEEHLLDRLTNDVYQKSMVVNINDESFGTASGVAIKMKLQPMRNLGTNKQRKVTRALRELYKMVFAIPKNVPSTKANEWESLEYTFTENIPENIADEVTTAKNAEGIVSKRTQLGFIHSIKDVDAEMEQIETEDQEKIDQATKSFDQYDYPNQVKTNGEE